MARPTHALIVDDEPHVRAFMRLLLREVGVSECWEAADGQTALALIQQHEPGLVLLDINLPQMSGIDVLAKLNELQSEVPVVMITSQSAMSTVNETLRLGAVGYILKHSPKEEAVEALRDVVESLDEETGESA